MKTIIVEPDFNKVEADVLVIGVPEHPENTAGWDGFVNSFNARLPEWLKSGDIKTTFNKIVKMPAMKNEAISVYCLLDSVHKGIDGRSITSSFCGSRKRTSKCESGFSCDLDCTIYK